jgi:hypothetical protein
MKTYNPSKPKQHNKNKKTQFETRKKKFIHFLPFFLSCPIFQQQQVELKNLQHIRNQNLPPQEYISQTTSSYQKVEE